MITFKTQLEIRYLPVLNFRYEYRALVSPYLKDSKIEFSKLNTQEESIVLKFPDEGYLIDIRWDRIVYACDGKKDNFYTPNGPLFSFLGIFEKIKNLPDFGEVLNILVAQWNLIESDKKEESIIESFKNEYFKNLPVVEGYQHDLAVLMDFQSKDKFIKLQFGPYNQKKDLESFNLSPISTKEKTLLLNKKGILIQTIATEKVIVADLNNFKRIDNKIEALNSQIVL